MDIKYIFFGVHTNSLDRKKQKLCENILKKVKNIQISAEQHRIMVAYSLAI